MQLGDLVFRILWLGYLPPTSDLRVVGQTWHASRQRNAELGFTGAMVFDGERFCELLEGDAAAIEAAHRSIEGDARLTGPRSLHVSRSPEPRRLSDWRCGYCDSSELDVFCGTGGLEGEAALEAFIRMLSRCDLLP